MVCVLPRVVTRGAASRAGTGKRAGPGVAPGRGASPSPKDPLYGLLSQVKVLRLPDWNIPQTRAQTHHDQLLPVPPVIWPSMASAGTQQYSSGLKRGIPHSPDPTSGNQTSNSSDGHPETKSRWLVPQLHVKPIWRLEKKHVPVIEDRTRALSGIFPQKTYYFFPGQLTTTDASTPPLRTVFSAPQQQTGLSCGRLANTLVFQQSTRAHKPYQKLESLCLSSEASHKRAPHSPSRNPFAELPANILAASESAMSSFVDQYRLPSAVGEPPNLALRTPSVRSRKVSTGLYKQSLNTNSFLRPNSAAVPSYLSQESRKVKNPRMSPGSASWHQSGGNGDGTTGHLDAAPPKSNSVVLEPNHMSPAAFSVHNAADPIRPLTSSKSNDVGSRRGRTETRDKEMRLTEAVRKLSQNGFSKNHFNQDIGFGKDMSSSVGFQGEAPNANCKRKAQTVLQPKPLEEGDRCISVINHLCINRDANLTSSQSANAQPNHIAADSLTSNPDIHGSVPPYKTVSSQSHKGEPSKTKGEDGRVMNVTAVTTQISTIQLDKKIGGLHGSRRDLASQTGDNVASGDVHLPDHPLADDLEEELANGLEDCSSLVDDDDDDDDDDESDSSVTGIASSASMLLISRKCMTDLEQTPESPDKICKAAFTPSTFPNVPPTLYFGTRNETVELLPWEQRKLLKWRMSTVTPNVVKQVIARSHFRITKKNHDWLGCWGHHMKSPAFKTILEHQKLNHFPGSFQIGRKDRLWRNLSKMQVRFGRKEFNFFPQSFVLPLDIKLLKKAWEESGTRQKWIVKPPASARGIGIQVIHKWSQLPKRRPLLVQRYLHKPYLISGSKFDLRIYVYVTSFDPLRVYLFTDGLVRFASCKYSSSMKSLGNKFMHLTNYSVNKKNSEYKSNADETACQGHKWALKALWMYLNEKGVNSDKIWEKIKDIVIKTIIASEPYVNSLAKMYLRRPYCCHELFGFDIMLDENLKPWILEVNISPSLHSNSPLDVNIKGQMIRDLLNLAGFLLPHKDDVTSGNASASSSNTSLPTLGKERSRLTPELFTEEKMKRAFYLSQKLADEDFYSTVLDTLTPDDVRTLVETEDEYLRRGQFERVFPSAFSGRYHRFFEQPRYLNILLNQWEQKYRDDREKGLELLKNFCQKGFHTGTVPDATHL
ncbi:tubulin monoglutamylase TTLL4 isoform X2 [Ambystoma mexicanum]